MLSFVERTAVVAGVQRLFALSTTTMQWFTERGFVEVREIAHSCIFTHTE